VVHGVLYGGADNQIVLVERTLTGAVSIRDTAFNPAEPILSDGGVPVINATVEILTPSGQTLRATEDRVVTSNRLGAGLYRFALPGSSLVAGGTYTLRIRTLEGDTVTATTTVPGRSVAGLSTVGFNRSRDTLDLRWAAVPRTRSYALRIDGPFGPFFLFTDSLHLRFNGELRNLFAENFPRVFIPGFRESLLIAAVDSNFYDYYRTQNDPFTGSGIISRVTGGIGFFGSMMSVVERNVDVTADRKDSVEGRFVYAPAPGTTGVPMATELSLFLESPALKPALPASLSGSYTTAARQIRGMLGVQLGSSISVALLAGQVASDTVAVFTGELRGDSLIGAYRNRSGTTIFVRAR